MNYDKDKITLDIIVNDIRCLQNILNQSLNNVDQF